MTERERGTERRGAGDTAPGGRGARGRAGNDAGAPDTGPAGAPDIGPAGAPDTGPVRRRVARVVLLDPDDRVLLMCGHEPDDPGNSWWFTPGGGLEGDETRAEAALRELAEETGITEVDLGPVLWKRYCSFPFAGLRWEQDEWYYLARTRRAEAAPRPGALTELESQSLAGLRWWTSAELSAAHETVYPTRLAELLRTLLDEGPPRAPVVLAPEVVRGRGRPAHNGGTHG